MLSFEDAIDLGGCMVHLDGFEDAVVGVTYRDREPVLVYDVGTMLNILVHRYKLGEEAYEYLEFSVFGADMGPQTPVYLDSEFRPIVP